DPVLSLGILYDLEEHPGSTLCVDRDLTIRYLNPAWYQFMDVTGQVTDFDMGTGLCDGYREREKTYFTAALNRVFRERRSLSLDYECACRDAYRLFELNAAPLGKDFLVIRHILRFTLPHLPQPSGQVPDADSVKEQCPQCLRFRAANSESWHWINEWVPDPPEGVEVGLCPTCTADYRPGVPI
ncbi:MAG: hypothetical protein HKN29_16085, partial [Rhodothermales bacterium]|nr:hypothetical protein [Rhodothermales bacterium]